MSKRKWFFFCLILGYLFFFHACGSQPKNKVVEKIERTEEKIITTEKEIPPVSSKPSLKKDIFKKGILSLPPLKREFRAAWVASIANINWPSRKNLSTAEQKKEAVDLLDILYYHHFNAVILQIRPSADALYKSSYEPWSYYLSGETGTAPSPYYDPLEFWIEEAHKRGIELHVWLNPFRAHHTSGGKVSSRSMVRRFPFAQDVIRLHNGMYWLDPSSNLVQDYVSKVVAEIVKKYDVDAVHFDDYFYPYANYNGGKDFPDFRNWNRYKASGGKLSKADWRRNNVNTFVERIAGEIKREKKYVKFGISPFGIWRSGYPASVEGSSQYDELYADAKLWLNKGWVDYFAPQLYWPISSKKQSFFDLLLWWKSQNYLKRHLWPGLNTVEVKVRDKAQEITDEIRLIRSYLKESPGEIHWSIAGLTNHPSMLYALKKGVYKERVLVPKTPWIKAERLPVPQIFCTPVSQGYRVSWSSSKLSDVFHWVLYAQYGSEWRIYIFESVIKNQKIPKYYKGKPLGAVAIQSVDRLGNESDEASYRLP
ncbi:MAG: hypothetical protein FDW93_02345 [Bergeyella sp.]|nr:hypothetical protein [Bergeyella sp.]